ncbi:MAG TPA: hypothetical protein VFB62_07565 [Polyangiaceae bacterium]|jgi:hypothetical protein|nr:hypothetical protein [Polyangiaceae bacterium]
MRTLQRVLASGVLDALRARAHVQVAPESGEALRDEVEAIIAPALRSIRPQLSDGGHRVLRDGDARDAVESVVERIAQQLMESDHIDDIYADDRVIRRDAFRAIRDILLGYIRGEVDVDEDSEKENFDVRLDGLGYLVATASRLLEEHLLTEVLDRAAAATGARLADYDPSRYAATFARVGGAEAGRLAIEEAITEELALLVDADVVILPGMQQVLEVAFGNSSQEGFEAAIERAIARIQRQVTCVASCSIVDMRTIVACLTPLSDDAAERTEEHFGSFLSMLEEELSSLEGEASTESQRPRSPARRKTSASARATKKGTRRSTPKSAPARSKRKPKTALTASSLARPSGRKD